MSSYESFASVYDMFMDNVDYDAWCRYLTGLLGKFGVQDGLVCELGCGTGNMTERLDEAGYDMIGIDSSADMLDIAAEKKIADGRDILYLNQDMRAFELYGTVRAIVSVCDSMNYVLTEEDLLKVFRLANNYLDPGGVLIFDMNTAGKYAGIGDSTIAENREGGSFIWENSWDPEKQINEYDLTLFIPEEDSGLYRRYHEIHRQRAYRVTDIRRLIEKAGMIFEGAYEAFTDHAPTDRSERICFVAGEHGKKLTEEEN